MPRIRYKERQFDAEKGYRIGDNFRSAEECDVLTEYAVVVSDDMGNFVRFNKVWAMNPREILDIPLEHGDERTIWPCS